VSYDWGIQVATRSKILIDSATPEDCKALLLSIRKGVTLNKKQIEEKARERGALPGPSLFRNRTRLIDLGILQEQGKNELSLTDLGAKCKDLLLDNPPLFDEFMHYMHMTCAFKDDRRPYFRTYYVISKMLYDSGSVSEVRKFASTNIRAELEKEFGESGEGAIDSSSVGKVAWWIGKLMPPIFVGEDRALPRIDVSAQGMLLAISAYYLKNKIEPGVAVMLDRDTVNEICTLGFIDQTYFHRSIDKIPPRFPVVAIGNTLSGRSLLLRSNISVEGIV
jgi:hypothetical protein